MHIDTLKIYTDFAEEISCKSIIKPKIGSILVNSATGGIIEIGVNDATLHAEQNLISRCITYEIPITGNFVVSTISPCCSCALLLLSNGVTTVVTKELSKDLSDLDNTLIATVNTREDGFHVITYSYKPVEP